MEIYEYSEREERFNVLSHGLGFILSMIAMFLLVSRALKYGGTRDLVSVSIFGLSLILLYAASTLYHSSKVEQVRKRLNIIDHAAIYVLIAGTYTPFTLITLEGRTGWMIFTITWAMALIGILIKIFFTGKYELISTLTYVFMGWIIVIAIKPLIANLPLEGLYWLLAGGISYTVGALFYSMNRLKFNHGIFHIFVLIGSFCHFYAVYNYVLPSQ